MTDAPSGIYRILNTVTGKCYVGSSVHIENRLYTHRWNLERGTHKSRKLTNTWRKHGSDAFVFEAIETVPDTAKLLEREQFWIDYYDCCAKGYNTQPRVGSTNLGRTFDAGVRQRMAEGARRAMSMPDVKERHKMATRAAVSDPIVRKRTSDAAKRRWANPALRAKYSATVMEPSYRAARNASMSQAGLDRFERASPERYAAKRQKRLLAGRRYVVILPNGIKFAFKRLDHFSNTFGLKAGSASQAVQGRLSGSNRLKGYTFFYLDTYVANHTFVEGGMRQDYNRCASGLLFSEAGTNPLN